eukprot:768560-Hanusia_phi.AAC.3
MSACCTDRRRSEQDCSEHTENVLVLIQNRAHGKGQIVCSAALDLNRQMCLKPAGSPLENIKANRHVNTYAGRRDSKRSFLPSTFDPPFQKHSKSRL